MKLPVVKRGALLRCGALALLMAVAVAQTPTLLRPYIYFWQPGDAAYSWRRMVIDPPLTLTLDSANQMHLGIDPAALRQAPGNCSVGGANNDELTCGMFKGTNNSTPGVLTLPDPSTGHAVTITVSPGLSQDYTITLPQQQSQLIPAAPQRK